MAEKRTPQLKMVFRRAEKGVSIAKRSSKKCVFGHALIDEMEIQYVSPVDFLDIFFPLRNGSII